LILCGIEEEPMQVLSQDGQGLRVELDHDRHVIWARDRMQEATRELLNGAKLVVVANREPYVHSYGNGGVRWHRPTGGLTAALDPVLRACGGAWVAHGSGEADRMVVDARGRVPVPPDSPAYLLRRVWLSDEEERGYYQGCANEGLWPLLHLTFERPRFDPADWEQYRRVNLKFAEAVLEEVGDEPAVVLIQDYHFALLARCLRERASRPDLVIIHCWLVPWPNWEVFRVCPWAAEILDGMLSSDLIAFLIPDYCENFLDAVRRVTGACVRGAPPSVDRGDRTVAIRSLPIGIDPGQVTTAADARAQERRLREHLGLQADQQILTAVDRVEYTKGIPQKFAAFDRLLSLHSGLQGKVCLIQAGAPSRTHIPAYRRLREEIVALEDAVNRRHSQCGSWRPITFLEEHCPPEKLYLLHRMASAAVVSPLHDGMNLVGMEFAAARSDLRGVLILSEFAGASRVLADALLVNPYDVDGFAEAMRLALMMPTDEQERRMRGLRRNVIENNVFKWWGTLISEAGELLGRVG
jgi:trehalose 6-phosphate synthase